MDILDWYTEKVYPVPESGCWLWMGRLNKAGYGTCNDGDGKASSAHRWSWWLSFGRIRNGLFVLHRCDIRCCVNPAHLFLGTHEDNMRDMVQKGRWPGKVSPDGLPIPYRPW